MNNNREWQDIFCGREDELQFLKDKFRLVAENKNPSPQITVLLGESGFGKTRLIQEFYKWLSNDYDLDGYWPPVITNFEEPNRINPNFEDYASNIEAVVPFLWWGVRFKDDNETEVLNAHYPFLIDHLKPMFESRLVRLHGNSTSLVLAEAATEIATSILQDYSMYNSIWKVKDLYDLVKSRKVVAENYVQSKSPEKESRKSRNKNLEETIFSDLKSLFSSPSKMSLRKIREFVSDYSPSDMKVIPAVIVMDNLHFADSEALEFFKRLSLEARENHWPILFIITDGKCNHTSSMSSTSMEASCMSAVSEMLSDFKLNESQLSLGKVSGLEALLFTALPGLTAIQLQLIVGKADGNPFLLHTIVRWLKRDRLKFVGEDVLNPLKESVENQIINKRFKTHELIEEELMSLSESTRLSLSCGSIQGMRFIDCLVRDVVNDLLPSVSSKEALDGFKETYIDNFINNTSPLSSEFINRSYYEVASDYLKDVDDIRNRAVELLQTKIEDKIENNELWEYSEKDLKPIFECYLKNEDLIKSSDRPWLGLVIKYFYEFPERSWQALGLAAESSKYKNMKNDASVHYDVPAGPTSDDDEMSLLHNLFLDILFNVPGLVSRTEIIEDLYYLNGKYSEYYLTRLECGFSERDRTHLEDQRVAECSDNMVSCCEMILKKMSELKENESMNDSRF